MSEGFPEGLLKDAIPRADKNMAGIKPPNVNLMVPPQAPQPEVKPKRQRKTAAMAPAPVQALVRPQFQQRPGLPQDAAKLAMLNQSIDMAGAGLIQHGDKSPYANFDPWADAMVAADGDIIESQGVTAPPLPPMQEGGPLIPSDDDLIQSGVALAPRPQPQPQARQVFVPQQEPAFLQQSIRVTLELTDGMMAITAIAVKENPYSVMMLLRVTPDGSIFIPKPGTRIGLTVKDKTWNVYFPGTYIEIEELKLGVMTFIKGEGEDGKA